MTTHVRFMLICFLSAVLLGIISYAAARWTQWARTPRRATEPRWRGAVATVAFGASTLSLLLTLALWTEAAIRLDGRFYSTTLDPVMFPGFWTAVLACVAGAIGKGSLRRPAIVSAAAGLIVWLGTVFIMFDTVMKEFPF